MKVSDVSQWLPLSSIFVSLGFIVGYRFGPLWKNRKWFTLQYKLVLVVPRSNVRLTNNQIISQCSTLSISAYETSKKQTPLANFIWNLTGQPKILVQTNSADDFDIFAKKCQQLMICCNVMKNADANDFHMLMAVGPGPNTLVDQVTGHLKLLR